MEFENLLTLIKTVSDSELTDFDYEENGTRIRLKKKKAVSYTHLDVYKRQGWQCFQKRSSLKKQGSSGKMKKGWQGNSVNCQDV